MNTYDMLSKQCFLKENNNLKSKTFVRNIFKN